MTGIQRTLLWVALLLVPPVAWGLGASHARPDDKPTPAKAPETGTRFEEFAASKGEVMVMESYAVGKVPTNYDGNPCEVELRRFTRVRSGDETFGLRVSHDSGERYSSTNAEFIDEDELDSVAAALAYFRENRAKRQSEAPTTSEFTFISKGGLRFGFFVNPGEHRIGDFIQLGHDIAFVKGLPPFEAAVDAARKKIRELRGGK